jgi:hypothetical protein
MGSERVSVLTRWLLGPVAGLTVAVAACVGCSDSGPTVLISASGGTLELPSASWNADAATFCRGFNLSELGQIWTTTNRQGVLASWDALTAEAPSEIRADFQLIDDYLRSVVNLHPDPSEAAQLGAAARHIGAWFSSNCAST